MSWIRNTVRNNFWVKILKFFDADADPDQGSWNLFDPESGFPEEKNSDPGSVINIPGP
jgi:hypothetical protein